MIWLILGVLLWSAAHLFKRLAPGAHGRLVGTIGEGGTKGVVAVAIVASIVLMVVGYRMADTPTLWGRTAAMTGFNNLLVLFAFYLYAASGAKTRITRIIRHPQLIGFKTWAVAHLLVNGDVASIVLFGGLLAWGVAEMALINRAEPNWTPPPRPPAKKELVAVAGGIVVFGVVALLHTLLGYNPFG
ncbi:putative membrane protein [Rhodovulum iodosum]|uniref:Membrane protein n=1 Tax=Rhodovulum iodosum TaxID=68291 RepID=A0ABV3XT35_9RHOB|nr:NnrU family protein [Rhodovulum robiginosum]RSK30566.1 hypothetical protein EJA01_17520 [Rhodovulum robiginosum]